MGFFFLCTKYLVTFIFYCMNIKNAKLNTVYKVCDIEADNSTVRRLNELGLYRGGVIVVRRKSILGKSYLVELQGSFIAIRYSVLKGVSVNG